MSLTQQEVTQFYQQGYLVKPGIFSQTDLQPLKDALTAIIDQQARTLQAKGDLTDIYAEAPFGKRLAQIYMSNPDAGNLITQQIMGRGGGGYNGEAILQCIRHAPLLSCIESLIGPEIVGSSVYRIRPKLPGWARGEVPWHQDSGYTLAHCDRHLIVTCWVPLIDATIENGCLHVIPLAHKDGILHHYTGGHANFLEVPQDELPPIEPVAVPMQAGDVLLLTNLTPHASFANTSDEVRWSIDLRYQGKDVPNNVDEDPASYTAERDPVTMACYPPEADFVIRDTQNPTREVRTAAQFRQIRERYDRIRPASPGRGWTPLKER
ncbi:MAG: phytanoyl-CoA dioxygenase family protein [Caldilineaceae bacterium]